MSPHFFLLGVAFLLLETRSLVTFSLLFGTTWIVNALVFFAILASVLAAIAVNARFRVRDPRPFYVALLLALLIGWLLPPASLLLEPASLLLVVAALYGAAYLASTRIRQLADRELEAEQSLAASAGSAAAAR